MKYIIPGAMSFNEVGLQDEGFLLRFGEDGLKGMDLGDQQLCLGIKPEGSGKIAGYPFLETPGESGSRSRRTSRGRS